MGYYANGYGHLTIDSERLSELKDKWGTLLNTPVASDKCKCRLSQWRSEIEPCNGSHKTLYENEYFYAGGQTLEQYLAYSFEDIAELFGYEVEIDETRDEKEQPLYLKTNETLMSYRLNYEDQKWHYDDQEVFFELLKDFCKDDDSLHFEGDDEEHWMYLYKDGTFTYHDAVVEVLYPTAYEKDARIVKQISKEETNYEKLELTNHEKRSIERFPATSQKRRQTNG